MNLLPPFDTIPIVVSELVGDHAVYVMEQPELIPYIPFFGPAPTVPRLILQSHPRNPQLVGSTRGFGAWMAHNLAEAYRPEVPR